ncbi:MAG TPA: hypothetical protein VJM09_11970 [Sphingobium sp.]|nr:hypothetical protein [Sphingobium sp.]
MTHDATFDPTDWLDRFEAAGGGWIVRDARISLYFPPDAGDQVVNLERSGQRDAVLALIRKRHDAKELHSAE